MGYLGFKVPDSAVFRELDRLMAVEPEQVNVTPL